MFCRRRLNKSPKVQQTRFCFSQQSINRGVVILSILVDKLHTMNNCKTYYFFEDVVLQTHGFYSVRGIASDTSTNTDIVCQIF